MECIEDLACPEFRAEDYYELKNGGLLSKQAMTFGEKNILHTGGVFLVEGRAVLRGDTGRITIGANVVVRTDAVIRPAGGAGGSGAAQPVTIGDYVVIEEGAVVFGRSIGSYTRIGRGAVVGRGAIIEDCVDIAPGVEVAPGSIVPAFTRVCGPPVTPDWKRDLLPCWRDCRKFIVDEFFKTISPRKS